LCFQEWWLRPIHSELYATNIKSDLILLYCLGFRGGLGKNFHNNEEVELVVHSGNHAWEWEVE
jgi:hypothetical protein